MNKTSMTTMPILLALALPIVGCQTMATQISSSGTMGPDDGQFVTAAYSIAQLDERAGTLAAKKAADPRVQDIAAKMSAEAQVLYPNLQGVLKAEHQPIPSAPPADVNARIQKLNSLSGPAFDREFIAAELDAHQRAVSILQKEDATTKDGWLKTQVETELPAVQANLDTLKFLASDLAPKQG